MAKLEGISACYIWNTHDNTTRRNCLNSAAPSEVTQVMALWTEEGIFVWHLCFDQGGTNLTNLKTIVIYIR